MPVLGNSGRFNVSAHGLEQITYEPFADESREHPQDVMIDVALVATIENPTQRNMALGMDNKEAASPSSPDCGVHIVDTGGWRIWILLAKTSPKRQ